MRLHAAGVQSSCSWRDAPAARPRAQAPQSRPGVHMPVAAPAPLQSPPHAARAPLARTRQTHGDATKPQQELRQGKYQKLVLTDPPALRTVAALGLPVESSACAAGAAALPPASVQQLMVDHRRLDLLQPFKLALLKLASQVGAARPRCLGFLM